LYTGVTMLKKGITAQLCDRSRLDTGITDNPKHAKTQLELDQS
jgi:hypothetical protein